MIDLHTHSSFSDGSMTPEQLVAEAERQGLAAVALTDHDTVGGVERFLAAGKGSAVRAVPGVEISVDYAVGTMHVLGYFVDHHHPALLGRMKELQSGRSDRNDEILRRLNSMGLILGMNEVRAYAGEDNVGRLHFSLALVARGYVRTREEAFEKYLAKGKQGYVDRPHLTPEAGITMIHDAGGVAVLAHPFTLNVGKYGLIDLAGKLVGFGLDGIEVYYPQQSAKQCKLYRAIARQFDLVSTGGTDFHGSALPDIRLGRGFGTLNVPDSVLEKLDERRQRQH